VELSPTGEMKRSTVMYEWQSAGNVNLSKDRLDMPLLGGRPGIYRFTITESSGSKCYYVGETENLSRRMNHYRQPGPTQQTNIRLNARLLKVLAHAGRVEVDVVVAALAAGESLDLSYRPSRILIESAELCDLHARGEVVENL
jgi:hypothetical protein